MSQHIHNMLEPEHDSSITHIAGSPMVIGNYIIQRCLLCGVHMIQASLKVVLELSELPFNPHKAHLTVKKGTSVPIYIPELWYRFYFKDDVCVAYARLSSIPRLVLDSDLDVEHDSCVRTLHPTTSQG